MEQTLRRGVSDYLKSIYSLSQEQDVVSTSALARQMSVSDPSVTGMLARLDDQSLVDYTPYQGVTLTDKGTRQALRLIRRHRLWELFLVNFLRYEDGEIHQLADQLEHVGDEQLESRLAALLGEPEEDPHGSPIPSSDGRIARIVMTRLSELSPGETGHIQLRFDGPAEMLEYVESLGLVPGAQVLICKIEPFQGPLTIRIGEQEQAIGQAVAEGLRVRKFTSNGLTHANNGHT